MNEKLEESNRGVEDSVQMVSWMMQTKVIRVAVLDYMSLSDIESVRGDAETIKQKYNNDGVVVGTNHVLSLASAPENQKTVKSLLQAVCFLTDPNSSPQLIFSDILNESQKLVNRTVRDSRLVVELKSIIGEMTVTKALESMGSVPDAGQGSGDSANHCKKTFDAYGRVVQIQPNGQPVTRNEFLVATDAAFLSMSGESIAPSNINGNWAVSRVVSPLWNQGELYNKNIQKDKWDNVIRSGKTETTEENLSDELIRAIRNVYTTGTTQVGGSILADRLMLQQDVRDTLYIDYCMIRGNCGWKGPHQSSESQDGALPYEYPMAAMYGYTMGKYCDASTETLLEEEYADILEMQQKHYVNPEERRRVEHDTDPYPRVVKATNDRNVKGPGYESARKVAWSPISSAGDEIDFSPESSNLSEASMYEFMLRSLELQAEEVEKDTKDKLRERRARCLRATAACIKIRQLTPMTSLKQNQVTLKGVTNDSSVCVTRPARHCVPTKQGNPYEMQRVIMPYDSGIALFERNAVPNAPGDSTVVLENSEGATNVNVAASNYSREAERNRQAQEAPESMLAQQPEGFPLSSVAKKEDDVTRWLRQAVESGWVEEGISSSSDVLASPANANFTLFAQPERRPSNPNTNDTLENIPETQWQDNTMVPDDVYNDNIHNAVIRGINALNSLHQIDKEHRYMEKLSTEESAERVGVFGLHTEKTMENATKDRRDGVWTDALREVNVSGDRLYRFITLLTGAIGESADSAISWEDEDLKQMSKEASARQRALSERVSRFQTKLVESVVSSTLKASKLQLDMRKSKANTQELVVLSSDTRDNVRKIADGEAGHGFFEAQVEFNDALGKNAKPMSIKDIVSDLQSVSRAFHDQIAASLAPSSGASYARIVEPRNSFMLHIKPDTLAATQKAYDYITSEMEHCGGYHRKINLWEFVEGKDWVLVTRFAELVGLMLQNTRMRSGSFAAYVGISQQNTNGHNIRMQIQRLRKQACNYLVLQPNEPMWLHKHGRTWYFGGSARAPDTSNGTTLKTRLEKRKCLSEAKDDDDYDACIGRQNKKKTRAAFPSKDLNRRTFRATRDSWKADDDGKSPGLAERGIRELANLGMSSAIRNLDTDLQKVMQFLNVMTLSELSKLIVQALHVQATTESGTECMRRYPGLKQRIQKHLCEAISASDEQYKHPPRDMDSSAQNGNKTNPYRKCKSKFQSCLPESVGDGLTYNNERYHAVKVVIPEDAYNGLPSQTPGILTYPNILQITTAFNEVFGMIENDSNKIDGETVGWFPHPSWMGKNGAVWNVKVAAEEKFKNVWVKKVQDKQIQQHLVFTLMLNAVSQFELSTGLQKAVAMPIAVLRMVGFNDVNRKDLLFGFANAYKEFVAMQLMYELLCMHSWVTWIQWFVEWSKTTERTEFAKKEDELNKATEAMRDSDEARNKTMTGQQQRYGKLSDGVIRTFEQCRQDIEARINSANSSAQLATADDMNQFWLTELKGPSCRNLLVWIAGVTAQLGGPLPIATIGNTRANNTRPLLSGPGFGNPQLTGANVTSWPPNGTQEGLSLLGSLSILAGNQPDTVLGDLCLVTGAALEALPSTTQHRRPPSEALAYFNENLFGNLVPNRMLGNVVPLRAVFESVVAASTINSPKYTNADKLKFKGEFKMLATYLSDPQKGVEEQREKIEKLKELQKDVSLVTLLTSDKGVRMDAETQRERDIMNWYSELKDAAERASKLAPLSYVEAWVQPLRAVQLGSFVAALYAVGLESEDGKKLQEGVMEAVTRIHAVTKTAMLEDDGRENMFANQNGAAFQNVLFELAQITGFTKEEIIEDKQFINNFKHIFSEEKQATMHWNIELLQLILEKAANRLQMCLSNDQDTACLLAYRDQLNYAGNTLGMPSSPSFPEPSIRGDQMKLK